MNAPPAYVGRFAPSPTGPLHFGSLVTACASFLEALRRQGQWLLRIEDLDRDRNLPGAAAAILADLERFGFQWHGPVVHQSEREPLYRAAFEQLSSRGLVYPCGCSRKELAAFGPVYPGICSNGLPPGKQPRSWRLRVHGEIEFVDGIQGRFRQTLPSDAGDFVVLRADGMFAYQLAVVVDDAAQGVTDVVRGADLLDSTPRQIFLQRQLALPTPSYMHVPVVLDTRGDKLSKQTLAPGFDLRQPGPQLWEALRFLAQNPPATLRQAPVSELWQWARHAWNARNVPATTGHQLPPVDL